MGSSIRLGTFKGIAVGVHWTFFLLLAWIAGSHYFNGESAGLIVFDVLSLLAVFACVLLHEFGHALTALRYGIRTRDITLLPIGGVARLERMPEKPVQEFFVAIGGPAVNVGILLLLVPVIFFTTGFPMSFGVGGTSMQDFIRQLVLVNIMLVGFNLLPAFPMDGGRVLRSLLAMRLGRERATQVASKVGQVFAVGFVLAGLYYSPMLILIGVFVFFGAQSELRMVMEDAAFKKQTVAKLTMPHFVSLSPQDTLEQAAQHLLGNYATDFLVVEMGQPVGVLTRDRLLRAYATQQESVQYVGAIMKPDVPAMDANMQLDKAWQCMREGGWPLLPVTENGLLIGILTTDNLADYFALRSANQR